MTEDYVSFETAKLLKEKGFDGKCYKVWAHYTSSTPMLWAAPTFVEGETIVDRESVESAERTWNTIYGNSENKNYGYLAPTLQMAMKWLRDVHHYYIQVMLDSWACGGHTGYYVVIQKTDSDFEMMLQDAVDDVFYKTYEQACEAAIKYCLENLI